MGLVSKPYQFSSGAIIVASEHNSNFDTLYNLVNGNLSNANVSASAAIAYSKITLTGSIVNADINSAAAIVGSKLNLTAPGVIGSVTPSTGAFTTLKVGTTNQGDILYDNGTSLIRLTPGTSGQFLKTQGAAANPVWGTISVLSNVLFQYSGNTRGNEYVGTSLNPNGGTSNYRFVQTSSGSYVTFFDSKFVKLAGNATVTVYCYIWCRTTGFGSIANVRFTIGSATGNVSGTTEQLTPEWKSFTIDVSALTTGTVYDITGEIRDIGGGGEEVYCGHVIGIGS